MTKAMNAIGNFINRPVTCFDRPDILIKELEFYTFNIKVLTYVISTKYEERSFVEMTVASSLQTFIFVKS
jgi:hypothetical protein